MVLIAAMMNISILFVWWSVSDIKTELKYKNKLTEKQNKILEKISESLSKTNNNEKII